MLFRSGVSTIHNTARDATTHISTDRLKVPGHSAGPPAINCPPHAHYPPHTTRSRLRRLESSQTELGPDILRCPAECERGGRTGRRDYRQGLARARTRDTGAGGMRIPSPHDQRGELTEADLKARPRAGGEGTGSDEGEPYGCKEERRSHERRGNHEDRKSVV